MPAPYPPSSLNKGFSIVHNYWIQQFPAIYDFCPVATQFVMNPTMALTV